MYAEILEAIKSRLESNVNAVPVQIGYYGDMSQVDLRKSAILMEPLIKEANTAKSTRWASADFNIRLWILVAITRDYMTSLAEVEKILAADDSGSQTFGLEAVLKQTRHDQTFRALTGTMGGSVWRIGPGVLDIGRTRFSVMQRGSERINTAQMEMAVKLELEG